jgi:RNA polymerase sigma-70 factor (ECF subfamily)
VVAQTYIWPKKEVNHVQLPDNEILMAIRLGNERVFEHLFKQHYASLCRYADSIVKDLDDAEEIVQTVFVTIWEKRLNIDIVQSLKSYLYRAVHNHCLNRLKHNKIKEVHQEYVGYFGEQHYEAVTEVVERNELEVKIKEAIEKLPEQCKIIFKLSRFEELKYQEIADKMGLSIKTIENQIGKALKIMRVELSDFLPIIIFITQFVSIYF